ncbi:MAG: YkgJ family cysteine cluster protein [Bacteroidales bacterium]|nr:YkgJ family cysteine cluster protein [Bacteroidales bacterium]
MECRKGCGACCIVPSISSAIPGMPNGKPAGVRCIHLTEDYRCNIFNSPLRPRVCEQFKAEEIICGKNREEAIRNLAALEEIDYSDFLNT